MCWSSVTFTKEAGTHYLRAFIFRKDEQDRRSMTVPWSPEDCPSGWIRKIFIAEEYILEVCSLGFKDNPGAEELSEVEVTNCFPEGEEASEE